MPPIDPRFTQAVQLHQAGRLGEAEPLYREVLQADPRHPHALHLLGVLAHQTGRHTEAADLIRRGLVVIGSHWAFSTNLASVYLALGQLGEAATQAREAIRLKPDHADAHNNLGVALRRLGRLPQAEACFREALQFHPNHVDARCNLGAVLQRQGNLPEALAQLRAVLQLAPRHAQAHNDLGGTLLACGDFEQAAAHLREALRLRPDFPEALSNLSLTLRDTDQIGEAERCLREALRLNPAYTVARNNLASNLEMQGRMVEAVTEFRETLRLEPKNPGAIAGLCRLAAERYCELTSPESRAAGELAVNDAVPTDDRCKLHFALASTFDHTGDFAHAFDHARRGNDLRRESDRRGNIVYDPAAHTRFTDRLITTFGPDHFERVRGFGLESELPIFIVGMMRSGTTLAEQILASHPRVFGAGELPDIPRLADSFPRRIGISEPFPECVTRLDAVATGTLADEHLRRLRQLGPTTDRVVDKLPANFLRLGLIATLFPKARIIHCRRDAADVCLSCYFQNFATPNPFTTDLRHLGHYHREYERLMRHWAAVLPLPVFDLSYEELTADQEGVSRRMVAFCGLPWDDRCLRFNETQRAVRTASALQVRKPMYGSSVGRWKRYEPFLTPLLEELRG